MTTWNEHRRTIKEAGWKRQDDGFWMHEETGAHYYPYNGVLAPDGVLRELWRVLDSLGQLPDPQRKINCGYRSPEPPVEQAS
jgi:hypothetical protein